MPALLPGKKAPDFTLPLLGGGAFTLREALDQGPVLLAFFKVSCPTCQYALPFLERLYRAHRQGGISIAGISQDNQEHTTAFNRRFGIGFPVALEQPGYPTSTVYGLTNVPSIFLIGDNGKIDVSSVGWSRTDIEEIHRRLRDRNEQAPATLWQKSEIVLDFKPG